MNKIILMILSKRNTDQFNLKVGSKSFKKVDNLKYLSVNIDGNNNMHKVIYKRILSKNKYYLSISKLLRN